MLASSVLAIAAALATPAAAQTASQVTPPTFRPDLPRVSGAVVFSGEPGLEAPEGADRLSITLSGVAVEGGFADLAPETAALEARLVGGPIPVSAIFAAARDLEAAYAREGYVLVRVVLPAQSLEDGDRLRLVVVDGFIESVEAEGVPEPVRTRILAVTKPLLGQRGLKLEAIERRLLIAGDTPGVSLRSTLTRGAGPGATVLVVDARYRPVTGLLSVDNTRSDALGNWTIGLGADVNSVLGFGEAFYVRASGHPGEDDVPGGGGGLFDEHPRARTLAAGAIVPIGIEGMTFNVEGTDSRTTPEPVQGFQTSSRFQRLSARLRYPWIRSRTFNLSTDVIFDAESEEVEPLLPAPGTLLSEDELRVLRLAGDANWRFENGGRLAVGAVLSFGLDALGARNAEEAAREGVPLSTAGADADFNSLEIAATYSRPLMEHLAVSLYGRAQTSFGEPLVQSEQIGIASFRELSTFDAGTLGGDSGWVVRGDVLSPWRVERGEIPFTLTPYVFAATGALHLEEPTAVEPGTLHVSSIGIGVTLGAIIDPGFSDASLTLEFGRAFRDDTLPDDNRVTLVGSLRF